MSSPLEKSSRPCWVCAPTLAVLKAHVIGRAAGSLFSYAANAVWCGQVCGLLGVARSFGDYDVEKRCKIPGVCAEATVSEYILHPEDEFVIVRSGNVSCLVACSPCEQAVLLFVWRGVAQLACDGVWAAMSNDDAVEFVWQELYDEGSTIQTATNRLIQHALARKVRTGRVWRCLFDAFHALSRDMRPR